MADDYAEAILAEIKKLGINKALIPLATAYQEGQWHVYVDIDTKKLTFDIETMAVTRVQAFKKALAYLRRQISCAA